MKKYFNRLIVSALAFLAPVLMQAQTAQSFITEINSQVSGVREGIVTLVRYAIGIIGTIYVAINLIKYFRGQGDSQNSLIRVVVGLVMSVILIAVAGLIK